MGRVMALDVGDRRVGVAVTDPLGLFSQPLLTVDRQVERDYVTRLVELCTEYEVERLVVGLPLLPSGDRGEQAVAVEVFVRELAPAVQLPVEYWDESYTTLEAEKRMRSAGTGKGGERAEDKGRVDAVAAAVLLEEWLTAQDGQ